MSTKRSRFVFLTLLAGLAACEDDCGEEKAVEDGEARGSRVCVNADQVVVDESACADAPDEVVAADSSTPPSASASSEASAVASPISSPPTATPAFIGPPLPPPEGSWETEGPSTVVVTQQPAIVRPVVVPRPLYVWYYSPTPMVYTPGTRVVGGSFSPAPGRTYVAPSGRAFSSVNRVGGSTGVTRGVVGGSFKGSGAGS